MLPGCWPALAREENPGNPRSGLSCLLGGAGCAGTVDSRGRKEAAGSAARLGVYGSAAPVVGGRLNTTNVHAGLSTATTGSAPKTDPTKPPPGEEAFELFLQHDPD